MLCTYRDREGGGMWNKGMVPNRSVFSTPNYCIDKCTCNLPLEHPPHPVLRKGHVGTQHHWSQTARPYWKVSRRLEQDANTLPTVRNWPPSK
ncbi:UNVERIFIED_CONTAM: hypothetical protein K2H54_014526 [Gekko kuhli]